MLAGSAIRPLVITLAGALVVVGIAEGQGRKLNAPLAHRYAGGVGAYRVTPGGRLVYEATSAGAGSPYTIQSRPLDGSAPSTTLAALDGGRDLLGSTPDGARILFRAGQVSGGNAELYSVPPDGSEPARRLHRAFADGEDVLSYSVSPDGRWVVYEATVRELAFRRRLFAVPPDGAREPILLTPTVQVEPGNPGYAITPDSARVVFLSRSNANNVLDSVAIDGSAGVVQLSPTNGASGFQFSADGRVVYDLTRFDGVQNRVVTELFVSPTNGAAPALRLNAPLPVGGQVGSFQVSPDSTHVVYASDQVTDDVFGLYSVPLDGGTPLEIAQPGTPYGLLAVSPDGAHVVYRSASLALFSVPADGSRPPVGLSGGLGDGLEFQIAPDSLHVVFAAGQGAYAAPLDGSSAPVTLVPAATNRRVQGIVVLPGSDRALFRVRTQVDPSGEYGQIFSARLDGSASVRLDAAPFDPHSTAPRGALSYLWDPVTGQVFYRADETEVFVFEIYAAPADGSRPSVVRSDARFLEVFGSVASFLVAPDGERVTYLANLEVGYGADPNAGNGAWGVPLVGPAQSFRLPGMDSFTSDSSRLVFPATLVDSHSVRRGLQSALLAPDATGAILHPAPIQGNVRGDVADERTTSDSAYAVYRYVLPFSSAELYAIPVAGEQEPDELTGWSGGRVHAFELGPDARTVVFRGGPPGAPDRLHLVRVGSSAPPLAITPVPAVDGGVTAFALSADGRNAVYLADQDADEVFELYTVAANGLVRKLNDALVPGGDVTAFRIQPDSRRVVFLADRDVNDSFELFSVPIDGSSAPTKIVAASPQVSVADFQVSPDSARVVLRADLETAGVVELFAVPTAGGAPPWKLAATPVQGGDVHSFQISPDAARVVFVADQERDEVFELFSAPIDGSSPPVRLSMPLRAGRDVSTSTPFQLDPLGRWVLYNADVDADEVYELYAAPIDGPLPAVRINGPLRSATPTVVSGRFSKRGVVYLAEEDTPGATELFLHEGLGLRVAHVRVR